MVEVDGRRLRRERSRASILAAAVDLASREGLEQLTIGRLADLTGMSRSGLFASFGSKEQLQLATVRHAAEIFASAVVEPSAGLRGADRLRATLDAWLSYLEDDVFPGGCFFMAAAIEWDAREGPVRDAVAEALRRWLSLLERLAAAAYAVPRGRARQLAFELNSVGLAANFEYQLFRDRSVFRRARAMLDVLLPLRGRPPARYTGRR